MSSTPPQVRSVVMAAEAAKRDARQKGEQEKAAVDKRANEASRTADSRLEANLKHLKYASAAHGNLFRAAACNNSDYIENLPDGAPVNDPHNGLTALIWAAYHGHVEALEALLEKGADVNARDKDGWSALTWSCNFGDDEIVNALVLAGADIIAPASDGRTPITIAREKEYTSIVATLNGGMEALKKRLDREARSPFAKRAGSKANATSSPPSVTAGLGSSPKPMRPPSSARPGGSLPPPRPPPSAQHENPVLV